MVYKALLQPTDRSKFALYLFLTLFISLCSTALQAQFVNNNINYDFIVSGATWTKASDGICSSINCYEVCEPTYVFGVEDAATTDANFLSEKNSPITDIDEWLTWDASGSWPDPFFDLNIDIRRIESRENFSGVSIRYGVVQYEWDGAIPQNYFHPDDDDYDRKISTLNVNPATIIPGTWQNLNISLASGQAILHYTQRLSDGDNKETPLQIGSLAGGFSHTYSTNSPATYLTTILGLPFNFAAKENLGYHNNYTAKPGNDVFYKFTIEDTAQLVNINLSSGFNGAYVALLSSNGTSVIGEGTANASSTASISKALCPGSYLVVVDGTSASSYGTFTLSINSTKAPVTSGSIDIDYTTVVDGVTTFFDVSNSICAGVALPAIYSSTDGTALNLPVTYKWYKKGISDSEWTEIFGEHQSTLAAGKAGNMPLNASAGDYIDVQRWAFIDCTTDNVYGISNTIRFIAPMSISNPGSIALRDSCHPDLQHTTKLFIPIHHDPGCFVGVSAGNGDPAPVSYQWQYKVGLTAYLPLPGANDTESYDISSEVFSSPGVYKFRRVATNGCGTESYSNELEIEALPLDGKISGLVSTPPLGFGTGIDSVQVCAIPQGNVQGAKSRCTFTDGDGLYTLDSLYYGQSGVTYYIYATRDQHVIRLNTNTDDSVQTKTLTSTTKILQNINFVDLTSYSISGNIYQDFPETDFTSQFGKQDVVLKVNGIPADTTDQDGNYALVVPYAGNWTIEPELKKTNSTSVVTHTFEPASRTLFIDQHEEKIDFKDLTVQKVSGFVGAGCDIYFGTVQLKFRDREAINGATNSLVRDFRTDPGTGTFSFFLPAREYEIQIEANDQIQDRIDPFPYQITNVQNQLSAYPNIMADLTFADTAINVYYRPPLTIELTGIPETGCGDLVDIAILEHGLNYPEFRINVYEGPSMVNGSPGCPLDTGYIDLNDGIGEHEGRLPISNGQVNFILSAGYPNLGVGHLKYLDMTASNLTSTSQANERFTALVTGEKPQETTFTTVSPSIPLLILHDPPTDRGYSWVEKNMTSNIGIKTFLKSATETGKWFQTKNGLDISISNGLGVEIGHNLAFWGSVDNNHVVEETATTIDETVISMYNTKRYETSQTLIGDDGDIFVGGAFNFIYAKTDVVSYDENTCAIKESVGLVFDADSLATTFIKTSVGIQNTINQLRELVDDSGNNLTDGERMSYENEIHTWEQMLTNNRNYKKRVVEQEHPDSSNITIDGQVLYSLERTYDSTTTNSYEFLVEVDQETAFEAGFEVMGNGAKGGSFINFKMESSPKNGPLNTDTTVTEGFTSGFTLFDDDPNDAFAMNIYKDARYNTPLFHLYSARTSCPYEGAYARVDNFEVNNHPDYPSQLVNVAPNNFGEFRFIITNTGDFASGYHVYVNNNYNTEGAMISIQGQAAGLPAYFGNIAPGQSANVVVTVSRQPGDPGSPVYSYHDLHLIFESDCRFEGDSYGDIVTRQEKKLDISFISVCSKIDLVAPTEGRIVNLEDLNHLQLIMKNYDKTKIDNVILQYSQYGSGNWINSQLVVPGPELNPDGVVDGTAADWDLIEVLEDGNYELRLKVVCGSTINYSSIVGITIDRQKPFVIGIPSPQDDDYEDQNDIISANYNELIDCASGKAKIVDLITNDTLPAFLHCFGNEIIVTPLVILGTRTPSIYRVIVEKIKDIAGNTADTYRWVFKVGEVNLAEVNCIPDLNITNNNENQDAISVTSYKAINITSSGLIQGFGMTTYTAQESAELNSGFEVSQGGTFTINIKTCDQ